MLVNQCLVTPLNQRLLSSQLSGGHSTSCSLTKGSQPPGNSRKTLTLSKTSRKFQENFWHSPKPPGNSRKTFGILQLQESPGKLLALSKTSRKMISPQTSPVVKITSLFFAKTFSQSLFKFFILCFGSTDKFSLGFINQQI